MASGTMDMQCWKCGSQLKNLLLPFSRYEECTVCKGDLHVCLACRHYDPKLNDGCREDRAEFVLDKDKANFCDYFRANPKAYVAKDDAEARAARARLAELFGEPAPDSDAGAPPADAKTEADQALAELKKLFGDN
ncbi:MAG: hypothetical protein PsegKO_27270 [Pseudohongiellaceae bacterium]